MSRRGKRGSVIVEAAIMLPIFVIMVVTFCWLIKACVLEIQVYDTVENALRKDSVVGMIPLQGNMRNALEKVHVDGADLKETGLIGTSIAGVEGFSRLSFTYDTKIEMPIPLVRDIKLKNRITYRAWKGYENPGSPLGFDAMAESQEGHPVYIFPTAGVKYHNAGCSFTKSAGEQTTLSARVREQYSPCPLCTLHNEADGTAVVIFPYGACYHRGGCSAVTKYMIRMDRVDAEAKGYTACSKCGG